MKTLTLTAALILSPLTVAASMGTAPNFTLADSSGKTVSLSALKGQPVALTFWATWCPTCKAELPQLETQSTQLGFKNHYAVSATDTPQDAYAYFQKAGYRTIKVLAGGKGSQNGSSVARAYRIIGQPVTVFIDGKGAVVAQHSGAMSKAQYTAYLGKAGFKPMMDGKMTDDKKMDDGKMTDDKKMDDGMMDDKK